MMEMPQAEHIRRQIAALTVQINALTREADALGRAGEGSEEFKAFRRRAAPLIEERRRLEFKLEIHGVTHGLQS
jgi:broad specificity phosphatase PhoE